MQKFATKLLLALSLIITITLTSLADNPPKREFRGVWFTTGFGIDWPSNPGTSNQSTQKAELDKYISSLDNLNINTICFQVRSMSDAMYQSSTLPDGLQIPWSSYISGTGKRGTSPGWDPLAYAIEECHKRGIEVYAWINPFRWANAGTEWTTSYDTAIKNKGWLIANENTTILNPGIPEVRQHIVYVCKDIISNYGVEGIVFDDYFYPYGGTPESSDAPDYTLWKNSGTSLSIGDWRRQNVDLALEGIYNMIQETRPEVRFVAGPASTAGASASKYGLTTWNDGKGYDNIYSVLYCDPLSWLNKGIIDMTAPQIYWHRDHSSAPFNPLTDWWYEVAKHFDRHNCVSMNIYDLTQTMSYQEDLGNTTAHYNEHVANIKASREYAAKHGVKSTGVNFYKTCNLVNVKSGSDFQAHGEYLRDNCFQRKSINPEIHWKNTPIYSAVNNLAYSSGKLSWTAAPVPTGAHSLTTIRYTVYAIPNSVNYESAITDDGFDGEYLQGVTYNPSYTLASNKQSGYWYAVCVFDGYGNEHAPAIYNYAGGTSAQVSLSTPSNQGAAKWEQTFSWNAVSGATYQLLISEYENFSNILFNIEDLTTTSTTLNLESLTEGKTYYWKVISKESGKIATDSEIYSFTVSSLTDAPLAQLETPTNGATVKNKTTFSWSNDDEHVTSFTFQIATDANFSNVITTLDFDKATDGSNTTTIDVNGMAPATYYWRVISKGRIYYDTPSAVQSFVVAELPTLDLTITSPDNNHLLSEASQHFEWNAIDGATYLFEIATDDKFSHVILSKELSTNSYDVNFDNLTYYSTYYWRVTAYKEDYKDTSSEVRTLVSDAEYKAMGDLTIETLWNNNVINDNLHEELNGDNRRSMTAYKGNVYVTRRNSDYTLELLEYDGKTGDFIRTITLTGACENHKTYGANGIFVDGGGNLCVTSIGMSASTQLTVCTVNISTGETTQVFSDGIANWRVDYANAFGDITATGGQIWGAVTYTENSSYTNYIYRWTRQADDTWKREYSIANEFYPEDASIGGASWVMPISEDQVIVDGGSNYPTLYKFNAGANATRISGFDSNSDLAPVNTTAVGMDQITLGVYSLFIYSNETHASAGYNFNIAHNPSSFDFSKMEKYWTIPKERLGDNKHAYGLNSVATIKNDDNSATVFVYAPLNGLAAYRISLPIVPISLNSPIDNTTFEEDFDFSWSGVEGATYTLELSTTESFDKIAFSATTEGTSYNSSTFNLAGSTQYYWRVKASHPNYTSAVSETRSFISPQKQSAADNLTIEELWNFSVNKGNLHSQLGDAAQRSMTAYNGNVYVTYRESSTKLHLIEFNGKTGAYIRTINLTGDCVTGSYGANCVFVDDANNLCVSTMGTSSSIQAVVCTVDINTGKTTKIFSYGAANLRFDYLNAIGDVTKEGGQIWGATAYDLNVSTNNNHIYRWTRRSDGLWTTETTKMTSFYPTNGHNGTAPWVMPISSTQYIVDGGSNYPTLYTFKAGTTATYESGFDSNTSLKPRTIGTGGVNQITIGKYPLFIYSSENHEGSGYNFDIVHNPSDYNFADMEFIKTIPNDNLGDTKHSSVLNSIATIKNEDNSATVFVYAPLNGLAAYRISLPDAPISLVSPINNAVTEDGFDFKWNSVSGSKYTIEVSSSESFENIEFSATTEANSYSSTNFSLAGSTQFYWRVKVENDNYTTTTSAVGQFISPALPTMTPPILYRPNDKTTHSSDISFVAKYSYIIGDNGEKIYTPKSTLEISKTADFAQLYYSGHENWKEESSKDSNYEIWLQYTLPISIFSNGTYYWRVRAESAVPNLSEGVSEVRQFIVEGQSEAPGSAETNYKPKLEDNPEYGLKQSGSYYYTFTNLWIRSSDKNNYIERWSTSTNYRGFCARSSQYGDQDGKDILWVAYHNGSTSGSLEKYDAATGEYIGSLQLTEKNENLLKSTYPCNDVFVDGGGNLCVMNLKGTSNDLQIAAIDPKTGIITHSVILTIADHRIDHARAIGDITSGEAYIFGTDNNTIVYRWELYDGEVVDMHTNTVTDFYPSKYVNILGTATRIYPIDKTHFYTDGTATAFTLYTFSETGSNATLTSSFNSYEGTDIAPASGNYGNGGTFFLHDGIPFIVYNNSSFASDKANVSYKFNLASVSELTSWGTINKFFNMPNDNIGTVINGGQDYGMLADYLQYDALTGTPKSNRATYSARASSGYDRTNIYIYVPGNGMAAYSLTRHIVTGAEDVEAKNIRIGVNNQEITFGCEVDNAQIYTLSGLMVNSIDEASSIEKPGTKGVYILRLTLNGTTTTHKIVI